MYRKNRYCQWCVLHMCDAHNFWLDRAIITHHKKKLINLIKYKNSLLYYIR